MLKVCKPVVGTVTGCLRFSLASDPRAPLLVAFLEDLLSSEEVLFLLEEGETVNTDRFQLEPFDDLIEISPLKSQEPPVRVPLRDLEAVALVCSTFERATKDISFELHSTRTVPPRFYNMIASEFLGHSYMNILSEEDDETDESVSNQSQSTDFDMKDLAEYNHFNRLGEREGLFETAEMIERPVPEELLVAMPPMSEEREIPDDYLLSEEVPQFTAPAAEGTQPPGKPTARSSDVAEVSDFSSPATTNQLSVEPIAAEFDDPILPPEGFNVIGALFELLKKHNTSPFYEPLDHPTATSPAFSNKVSFKIRGKDYIFESVTRFQNKKDAKNNVSFMAYEAVKNLPPPVQVTATTAAGQPAIVWKNRLQEKYQGSEGKIDEILRYDTKPVYNMFECTLTVTAPNGPSRSFISQPHRKKRDAEKHAAEMAFRSLFPGEV